MGLSPAAITDGEKATASTAFKALFKDDTYRPFVSQLLKSVSEGAAVITPYKRRIPVTPLFTCALTPGAVILRQYTKILDFYDECNKTGFTALSWSDKYRLLFASHCSIACSCKLHLRILSTTRPPTEPTVRTWSPGPPGLLSPFRLVA